MLFNAVFYQLDQPNNRHAVDFECDSFFDATCSAVAYTFNQAHDWCILKILEVIDGGEVDIRRRFDQGCG